MDTKVFRLNIKKLVQQRNIFLFFTVIFALISLMLCGLLFTKNERIVIVPTTGNASWIESNQSSQSYLESMGVFMADLLLNRSPSDIEWRNQTLLKYVHPVFYHEIKSQLDVETARILKEGQSFVFKPERSFSNSQDMSFVIEGESLILIGKSGKDPSCAQRDRRRYCLNFKCENGRLSLVSLKQKEI